MGLSPCAMLPIIPIEYYFFVIPPEVTKDLSISLWFTLTVLHRDGSPFIHLSSTNNDCTLRTRVFPAKTRAKEIILARRVITNSALMDQHGYLSTECLPQEGAVDRVVSLLAAN